MKYVKEQLLLFLNSKLTNPNMKGCSLALVGPPGVGKTTIARYLAEVMKWPFEQISFGGTNSSDFLKGHDYTYVGSKPGEKLYEELISEEEVRRTLELSSFYAVLPAFKGIYHEINYDYDEVLNESASKAYNSSIEAPMSKVALKNYLTDNNLLD